MTAHKLAAKLLKGPDLRVALYDDEYGEYFLMEGKVKLCVVEYKPDPYDIEWHSVDCVGLR